MVSKILEIVLLSYPCHPRYLYVDFENEELGCTNQKQFSAGGAGALPIYWDKVDILSHIFYVFLPTSYTFAICHIYCDKVDIHPSQHLLHQ